MVSARLRAFALGATVASGALAQEATFEGITMPGATLSRAHAVSPDGSTIVGQVFTGIAGEAFLWTAAGGMTLLAELPGGNRGYPAAVSNTGIVVGHGPIPLGGGDQATRAIWWTVATGVHMLPGLAGAEPDYDSEAVGVSADGSVIGGTAEETDAIGIRPVRWVSAGAPQAVPDIPGYTGGNGLGLSLDGQVLVGRLGGPNGDQAFRWTSGGGTQGLGDLAGGLLSSQALGASGDGSVVVGLGTSGPSEVQAFRWEGGTMEPLGFIPGLPISVARDVSADGSIVVGGNGPAVAAFIWTRDDGIRDLRSVLAAAGADVTGWTLREATGISADGTVIVGYGTNPQGQVEAWRAVLPNGQCLEPLAIRTWNDPLGGPFADPSNWSAGGVPGATDQAVFELSDGSDYTVSFVGSHTNDALLLRNGNHVRFDLAGQTYTATGQSGCGSSLDVRDIVSSPRLEIANGTVLALGAELSGPLGTELALLGGGRLTVAGGLLASEFAGDDVGVVVESGGGLVATGTGQVTVGGMGTAEINVEGGGEATFGVPVRIGDSVSGVGTLRAQGIDARITLLAPLVVGHGGSGILSARDQGIVDARDVVLGRLAGSVGDVFVLSNGHLATENLDVGVDGWGEVSVAGLGAVEVRRSLSIPRGPTGTGSVTVEADGGIVAQTIRLGVYGDGGTLTVDGYAQAGQFIYAGGQLLPEGACVRLGDGTCPTALAGANGTLAADTVWVAPGATLSGASVVLGEGGVLGGGGTLALDLTNAGAINPGDSAGVAGTFTIGGAYTQSPAGALEIELGGTVAGAYDQLTVAGAATLDGTLHFSHIGGFAPAPGDMFEVLTAASVSGAFAGVEGPPGCTYSLAYGPTTVTATVLTVAAEPPAGAPALVLHAPAPNPAAGSVAIRYELPAAGSVRLTAFDVLGREVAVFIDADQDAGQHEATLRGGTLASGLYIVKLETPAGTATHQLTIAR